MDRALFLDRDGVLNFVQLKNGRPHPPSSRQELETYPGIEPILSQIVKLGYKLFVVTNQPDVARRLTKRETVDEINNYLMTKLPITKIYTCYHDNIDNCQCRKPLPGLILKAATEYHIDLKQSYMVGDRWRDIEAGIAAGCKTAFIDYGYNEKQPKYADIRATSSLKILEIIQGEIEWNMSLT